MGDRADVMTGNRLLVVDDDDEVRDAVARALRLEGFTVTTATGGAAALREVDAGPPPDAIVLDVLMPDVDGLEVCRRLRDQADRTPILLLTARDAIDDRVAGLDAGADDYLVKPFALAELLARIRALVRRGGYADEPEAESAALRCADLELDLAGCVARRGDRVIELTRTEYMLLELLLRNAGTVLTREVILDRVWGYEASLGSNSLEVFVSCLRRKMESHGERRLLHTMRGIGYVMRSSP